MCPWRGPACARCILRHGTANHHRSSSGHVSPGGSLRCFHRHPQLRAGSGACGHQDRAGPSRSRAAVILGLPVGSEPTAGLTCSTPLYNEITFFCVRHQDHQDHIPAASTGKLGFGKIFTDHMFLMNYTRGKGWHDPRIEPFHDLTLSPRPWCFDDLKATAPTALTCCGSPWRTLCRP